MKKTLSILLLLISSSFLAQEEVDYEFKKEMHSKSLSELKLVRNEFYARQGYIFKSNHLNEHFSQFNWYEGTKSIDEIELSETAKHKTAFIKHVEKGKKLNAIRIKTLQLLAILPGDSMGSWNWSMEDRTTYAKDCKEVGYLINDNSGMMQKTFIEDKHLFVQVVDGAWEFSIIAISNHKYFILTNDIVGGGNSFSAYIADDDKITRLDKNIFPENWKANFKPLGKDCVLEEAPYFFNRRAIAKGLIPLCLH